MRDPRGVISSKIKVGDLTSNSEIYREARLYCQNVMEDISFAKYMIENNPKTWKRYYILERYEDIATLPEMTITRIYNMTGIKPDYNVNKWIKELYNKNQENQANNITNLYSTDRENPRGTAEGW